MCEIVAKQPDELNCGHILTVLQLIWVGTTRGDFILHLTSNIYFHVSIGMGVGSNNYAEILT